MEFLLRRKWGIIPVLIFSLFYSCCFSFSGSRAAPKKLHGYLKYCNKQVTGSDVVSAIRKFKNDSVVVEVTVFTSESHTKTMSTLIEFAGSFQNTPANANYINPAANFYGEAVRNSNNVIERIKFVQEKYIAIVSDGVGGAAGYDENSSISNSSEKQESVHGMGSVEENSQDSTQEGDAVDLDIIFSDEVDKPESDSNSAVSEKTAFLENVQRAVDNYSSELNDLLNRVKAFDIKEGDDNTLSNFKNAMIGLKEKIQTFWGQCSASKMMTDAQKKTVKSSLDVIDSNISSAVTDIDSLRKELRNCK